jgi:adenylate cyclase
MGLEIERKFLVTGDAWRSAVTSSRRLRQGYLALDAQINVRVRTDGKQSWLTIKGEGEGISRPEFEYEIPPADAENLLAMCRGRVVEKTRHHVPAGDHLWEIDEFDGRNRGLVVAELELRDDAESFGRPPWLGSEVSEDPRYLNANLAMHPFAGWGR